MTEYPPILSGTALQQIAALRDYLVRRTRAAEGEESAALAPQNREATRAASPQLSAPAAAALDAAPALRALVVKTADTVLHQVELLSRSLRENYLALSDFGAYQEQLDLAIRATARQIVESYDFSSRLSAAEAREGELGEELRQLRGQIRRGWIQDPETGEIAFGIAVSEDLRFTAASVTENGQRYEVLAPGQTLGLYTASGWQFWMNGSKRGWFDASDGQMHVGSLAVEQELRLGGDWLCTAAGGFGIRCLGA